MKRRAVLQFFAAAAAWAKAPSALFGQPAITAIDEARLRALAEVVLPGELSPRMRADVVDAFLRWTRGYREGAEMDHGYGITRLRRTAAPPATKYPAQLAALERAARARGGSFDAIDAQARAAIVKSAIESAQLERLPLRPTGDHVATDLMAFYFQGPDANDLAYRADIGRDRCRGLDGSQERPRETR